MVICARMAENDEPRRKSEADQTLIGVPPPRIESSVEALHRAPVYVRSGTSVADVEPALASAPHGSSSRRASEVPVAVPSLRAGKERGFATRDRWLELARTRPVLWMVVAPVLTALLAVWLGHHGAAHRTAAVGSRNRVAEPVASAPAMPPAVSITELEAKPPGSLSARELVLLADARSERERGAASALRQKVEANPALASDSNVQNELLRFANDDRTARDALAAMAALEPPVGADLLYEVWTRTPERSDTTELARALLYSADLRPKTSPALAVALALRAAESCEQYRAILPEALKLGDRRAVHLLTKLNVKRGCGPKKNEDCFACLRAAKDELSATINAVKSRHPPSYAAD